MIFDRKSFSSSSTVSGGPFLTCYGQVFLREIQTLPQGPHSKQ